MSADQNPVNIVDHPRYGALARMLRGVFILSQVKEDFDRRGRSSGPVVLVGHFDEPGFQRVAEERIALIEEAAQTSLDSVKYLAVSNARLKHQASRQSAEISALRATIAQYDLLYPPLP